MSKDRQNINLENRSQIKDAIGQHKRIPVQKIGIFLRKAQWMGCVTGQNKVVTCRKVKFTHSSQPLILYMTNDFKHLVTILRFDIL